MILAQAQSVPVALRLQVEAVVLSERLPSLPVLQRHAQLVPGLFCEPVEMLQSEPVLSVQVPKALLFHTETPLYVLVLFICITVFIFRLQQQSFGLVPFSRNRSGMIALNVSKPSIVHIIVYN